MSSRPRATSCCETARQQDDERGRARDEARGRAHPHEPLPGQVVLVVVVVAWSWWCVAPARAPEAGPQHPGADDEDHQPGDQVQPRIEVLGQDVLRQRERHEPEREHPDRVGDRHGGAQRERMAGSAPGAHQVGGDHRLAVTRGESVHRAPGQRGQQEEQQHAPAGGGVREHAGEPVAAGALGRRGGGPPGSRGAVRVPSPGRTSSVAVRWSRGLDERVLRIAAQPARGVAWTARWSARTFPRPAAPRRRASRLARGRSRLAPRLAPRPEPGRRRELEPRGRQPALARPALEPRRAGLAQRHAAAVRRDGERAAHLGPLGRDHLGVGAPALLEGGDLRLVEEIAQLDAVGRAFTCTRWLTEKFPRGAPRRPRRRRRGRGARPPAR